MIKPFKKNYKLIIGLMVGFLVSSTLVYALYMGRADELSYNNTGTWLKSTTVQDALDELNKQKGCPVGYVCYHKKSTLALGDYVSYTPSKTSYTTDTAMTGYTSTQTINPSELNLWRVISLNQDGTVDIISENVSSTSVYFGWRTGHQNFVGYLNVLASQYETAGITVGSRHFGYNGQTEYISDTSYYVTPAPWTCSTGGTCTPDPDDYEEYGGGDTLYQADYNLINTVLGTRIATDPNGTNTTYWMASRLYNYSSIAYQWNARNVDTTGSNGGSALYYNRSNSFNTRNFHYALRPIVTLGSSLSYDGAGTKEYPMEIQ